MFKLDFYLVMMKCCRITFIAIELMLRPLGNAHGMSHLSKNAPPPSLLELKPFTHGVVPFVLSFYQNIRLK